MKQKKENDNKLFSALVIGLLVLGAVISVITHNAIYGVFGWLGVCFFVIFLYNKSEYRKVRRAGVFVNAYVTDCEKGEESGSNNNGRYYILRCEAEDEAVYGTAEVCSEKYVPIGSRIVLFYSRSMNLVCPAEELEATKTDVVTLTASIICFTVAVGAYIVSNCELSFFSEENILRIVAIFGTLIFLGMGMIFLWLWKKNNRQATENHRYPAKLVRYRYEGGQKYPVWRYHYKGKSIDYESREEKKLWQKIGRESEVFVSENGDVFEKGEQSDWLCYGVIFLVAGIIYAVVLFAFDFRS